MNCKTWRHRTLHKSNLRSGNLILFSIYLLNFGSFFTLTLALIGPGPTCI